MHEGRKLNYSIFNKLAGLQQNEVVENKRLGSFWRIFNSSMKHWKNRINVQEQNKNMPSRKAQKADIEQRKLNPVLDSCG